MAAAENDAVPVIPEITTAASTTAAAAAVTVADRIAVVAFVIVVPFVVVVVVFAVGLFVAFRNSCGRVGCSCSSRRCHRPIINITIITIIIIT